MQDYQVVAVKRDRVPEWLYRALCLVARPLLVHEPLRSLLHREPRGYITGVKCAKCGHWTDPTQPGEWKDDTCAD